MVQRHELKVLGVDGPQRPQKRDGVGEVLLFGASGDIGQWVGRPRLGFSRLRPNAAERADALAGRVPLGVLPEGKNQNLRKTQLHRPSLEHRPP